MILVKKILLVLTITKKRTEMPIPLIILVLVLAACTGLASPTMSESSSAQKESPPPTFSAELREALELDEDVAQTPAEIIAGIRDKVSRALEEYAEGETDEAYELAAGAYLDGFEHLESDLLQHSEQELVETVELQFKYLRDGIKAGKSLDKLQALAAGINANLDKIKEVLE